MNSQYPISIIPEYQFFLMTAQSSIIHNGEAIGVDQPFHRETVMMPDGRTHQLPTITGNSFRGILRDALADFTCQTLGIEYLPPAQFYLLYSGGTLEKDSGKSWLSKFSVQDIRRLLPHLSLFGFSFGNKIAQGKINIFKLIPLCKEVSHLVPLRFLEYCNRSIYDMMQIEAYTRMDDGKREKYVGIIKQGEAVLDIEQPATQMRFYIESICAGAQFYGGFSFRLASTLEVAAFYAGLGVWGQAPVIGGVGRWGHGKVKLQFSPDVILAEGEHNPFMNEIEAYSEHLLKNKDEIFDFLTKE